MAKARKRFGQHFLEPAWVVKLLDAISPQPTERFIEIGPGRGAITEPLAARAEKVVAVEIDRDLVAALERRSLPRLTIVNVDVLDADFLALARDLGPPVRIAGNLPYNISSPILFRLLEASTTGLLSDAILMLQKEVADRLVADPGSKEYGVLTLTTSINAEVTRLLALPPGAFRPAPKVHSAVVRLRFRPAPDYVHDRAAVVRLVRTVFTQRRKTMANALAAVASSRGRDAREVLAALNIDPMRRPETLQLIDFARIADLLKVD